MPGNWNESKEILDGFKDCGVCKDNTYHIDLGEDVRQFRFKCIRCRQYNKEAAKEKDN